MVPEERKTQVGFQLRVFTDLNAVCQGDHDHDPWGVTYQMGRWKFDTASEAAYPILLAQRAAACLVVHAKSKGWSLIPRPKLHDLATASLNLQAVQEAQTIDSRISSSRLSAQQYHCSSSRGE